MAIEKWVILERRWCPLMQEEAEIMEHRVYAAEMMPDLATYQVKARKCSLDIACNTAGHPCKWAYTNPFNDPGA